MQRPTLYILLGYPGAGKTTTARVIGQLTGAVHLWTDYERRKLFEHPTHSAEESRKLYGELNREAERLLKEGRSVVFDTSFNYRKDRDHLRAIAAKYGAETVIIWLNVPRELAKSRALTRQHAQDNSYEHTMSAQEFDRIASHLEMPGVDEHIIRLDGTKILQDYVRERLESPENLA